MSIAGIYIPIVGRGGIPIEFDAVIARGGLLKPTPGGVYAINEQMKYDLLHARMEHACNLGALIADEMAKKCGCPAYIADPEVWMSCSRQRVIPVSPR